MTGSLCQCGDCVSLRRELIVVFGVPPQREGETWNAAMLRQIADLMGAARDQAEYVDGLMQQAQNAHRNLIGRLS